MNNIKVLVVEDNEENIVAAKKYFETKENVSVTFATNCEDGLKEMKESVYSFGIFDFELPKKKGGCPEKLGFELAKEAEKHALHWAILTSGFYHHRNQEVTFILYEGQELLDINKENEGEIKKIFTPKNDELVWRTVFEELLKYNPEEMLEKEMIVKERFRKFIGKFFNREET